jgi:hypothetical protein
VHESKPPLRSSICQADFSFGTESLAYNFGESLEAVGSRRCDRGQKHAQSVTANLTDDGVESRRKPL